jgi:hypothetical protein
MTDYDFYHDEFDKLIKIVEQNPISMELIVQTMEAAIPLINYLGPDGPLIAVINEKQRRGLDKMC